MRNEQKRVWFDGAAFRRDLRAAWIDASIALVLSMVIFGLLCYRVASGTSSTIEVMPAMADVGTYWMYWMCQAFGWAALLWAWISVMAGLLRSGRPLPGKLPSPQRIEQLHRMTSLTTIALMFLHIFWFFVEKIRTGPEELDWAGRTGTAALQVFVPGLYDSGTGIIAVFIGLLAFYLAIPLGLAFYLRRSIGARVWRVVHASVIVVYVLSVWHTLLYGTSGWYSGWFRTALWLAQLPIAALLLFRLWAPAHRPGNRPLDIVGRWIARGAGVGTVVLVLGVVVSGRDGGRTRGVDGAELTATRPMIWLGLVVFVVFVGIMVARTRRTAVRRRSAARPDDEPAGTADEAVSVGTERVPEPDRS